MSARIYNLDTRINTLNAAIIDETARKAVDRALRDANGDWSVARKSLAEELPHDDVIKIDLSHALADWSEDNAPVVRALAGEAGVANLRDVALRFNVDRLAAAVDPTDLPETVVGATDDEKRHVVAIDLHRRLYTAEPTAVLQRMVQEAEIPIADVNVRVGVTRFLGNQPDFNFRTTSVYTALRQPDALKDIAEEHRAGVIDQLKTISRVQAMSTVPEAVPLLMNANLTSAFSLSEMPVSTFVRSPVGRALGEETARQIHRNAEMSRARNEHALMIWREAARPTGIPAIDGDDARDGARTAVLTRAMVAAEPYTPAEPLDIEKLFGSMDYCECDECLSVYSPAAYFVELLQFLRNNNLGPDPRNPTQPNPGIRIDPKDISNTPLQKLFFRRPDLACLELTCENAFTILPYIDLINEVMESFVVHLDEYRLQKDPRQAKLETFNVDDETSEELLAQPQHTNYQAYCILKKAVYPFTLPYHQPIDATRIFLKHLGTTRYEVLKRFLTATETCETVRLTPAEQEELQKLHQTALDCAVDAEYLGLTQEEYIILTKEAFWPLRYFEITQRRHYTEAEYRQSIGVKPVNEYYGYLGDSGFTPMLSTDEKEQIGLTFVKKQFLRRTGIQYTDLVDLLKTQFINPCYPQGRARTILESLKFSYRFLQSLVDKGSTDPKVRFAKLIAFLEGRGQRAPLLDAMRHPNPCQEQKIDWRIEAEDLKKWVYCYFERIGKLIVLETGEKPRLPIEALILEERGGASLYWDQTATLRKDGTIWDNEGVKIGEVTLDGKIIDSTGNLVLNRADSLKIEGWDGSSVGVLDNDGTLWLIDEDGRQQLYWLPPQDTCDLEKVRLVHLDGTPLTAEEYDRMQRFIRLWRKMGWTIDETDRALVGLSAHLTGAGTRTTAASGTCDYVGFDTFVENCDCPSGENDLDCPDIPKVPSEITVDFLHQLVAVRKLLDLTGLPLVKLLAFWTDISTAGEKSLYHQLFLTHNMLGIDEVFKADIHGNYLTQPAKITEHIPVLMAALRLKADDIVSIMASKMADALTLSSVSSLYRHSLLAKLLHVKVADLPDVIGLFGNPFSDAHQALDLVKTWGKVEDAGFTFRQLNYLIQGHDDVLRPLAPAKKNVLRITKTLYDGLNAIDRDHPDVSENKPDEATADVIRAKAGLLFEQSVVERMIGLLEGTTVYTTNAPAGQTIAIPDALRKKFTYSTQKDVLSPRASIQVTGILTDTEKVQAKDLCVHPEWSKALDRVGKQALHFFNDALVSIFPYEADAKSQLLAGDVNLPADQQAVDPNTAPIKRFYFLKHFLPFLRRQLAHRFVVDTLSSAAGMPSDVTDVLLSDVLMVADTRSPMAINAPAARKHSAMNALLHIKERPAAGIGNGWKGYLIPPTEGSYTFVATSENRPAALSIDGQVWAFPYQQEDPSDVWYTDPVPLKSGRLYWLEVRDRPADQLKWKMATSPTATIPSSSLLPDYSAQGTEEVFTKLYKVALLVNGFKLNADEVGYWQSHRDDFDAFDFNGITMRHWRRLQAYVDLRDHLPAADTTLLDLFTWESQSGDSAELSKRIAAVTGWKQTRIEQLIAANHFDLNRRDAFRNEVNLIKLRKALEVADKVGVDIDRLFAWAKPGSKFWPCHQIAEDVRMATRARYDQEDWEKVARPLHDQLRENQKQALISYLLVQQVLIDWPVRDADGLFEFFLIDVQMEACRETSRIKQAISTVQLFIQRCLLGLEDKKDEQGKPIGVTNDVLDRQRWEWMQRYRVWEANRKVFLYPENWIEPTLRDDKSPFYKELESELLQKDINQQTVEDALKSYLFKVDEVANLKVVGLFQETETDEGGQPIKLHVFARTRNAPYTFWYRYYDITTSNWYPWEKVQVDIPSYDVEDSDGRVVENGTYLIPVIWNKRLLIFFPQFAKKTKPQDTSKPITIEQKGGGFEAPANKVEQFWEIKMAWSEYRNGKWMQKQVTVNSVFVDGHARYLPNFQFMSRIMPEGVVVDLYLLLYTKVQLPNPIDGSPYYLPISLEKKGMGYYLFESSQVSHIKCKEYASWNIDYGDKFITEFHYLENIFYPLQAIDKFDPHLFLKGTYLSDLDAGAKIHINGKQQDFYHSFVHKLLGTLATSNLDALYKGYREPSLNSEDTFGSQGIYNELKGSYSLYNWEAAFHVPMLLADRLLKSQQFDQALKMCHYVFNPLASGNDAKRFWQFLPFKEIDAEKILETLFMSLKPNTPSSDPQFKEWRDHPFQPHVLARLRPSAYMKWVVMKYVEILIAYGDYYFRQKQNMLEAMPMAIQCYVLASHILGPRRQRIPKRGKIMPQSYLSLLDKWDAFSNAMVELELAFPFSNQVLTPVVPGNEPIAFANIFGFASTLYFCIPDNPKLQQLRETIDDRLFKIRHCQDIEGVFFKPPLFEPPIDPGLLVQAAAQGLSLTNVLNDLDSPMPNYRFYYLLQKSIELCSELKALDNAFLSVKEKRDAEALSRLRAGHESSMYALVLEVRKQQLAEAEQSLESLQQSRKGPVYRLQHYLKLIGEDLRKVPDDRTDYSELPNQLEQPIDESGLKLIQYEKEEIDKASAAAEWQIGIGVVETLASTFHALPTIIVAGHPLGMGGDVQWGFPHMGNAAQAIARGLRVYADHLSHQSSSASRKGGFLRQLQDRVQQANIAGYEIKNIDKQILAQKIRIDIATKEVDNQQKQIDNAQEVEEFLRSKYTNEELYSWMEGSLRTLYYQMYTLTYDLARKAEKAYRFERGLATTNFVQFGYWDADHDGLLAGERLYLGLKQLEAAYQEKRGYDYEVTKHVSLRQINPLALIEFREKGTCEFALPEVLFDMDHPGHYMRRIKSVALTIPCVIGPYTSLNCTLRLLEHKFRTSPIVKDKNDYVESTDESDTTDEQVKRFSTVNVPITSIAASTGQNDSGVFELNFRDERYIPFEGAGVISKWRIELPESFRQFDYNTISDVVLHIRYTALDGGDKLKKVAADSLKQYIASIDQLSREEGLFAAFDLKHDFPSEWYKAMQPAAGATERVLPLGDLYERLPIFTKGRKSDKIKATDVYLFTSVALPATTLVQGAQDQGPENNFVAGSPSETPRSFAIKDIDLSMNSWTLKIGDVKTEIDELWLLVRYRLLP